MLGFKSGLKFEVLKLEVEAGSVMPSKIDSQLFFTFVLSCLHFKFSTYLHLSS